MWNKNDCQRSFEPFVCLDLTLISVETAGWLAGFPFLVTSALSTWVC